MSAQRLTRRSLLAATAGALAAPVLAPATVLGALVGPPRPRLQERWVGRLGPQPVTITLERLADLLGVEWLAPPQGRPQLRFRTLQGGWSPWVTAAGHGHGPDGPPTPRRLGDPVWSGGTRVVQLRAASELSGVRLHLIDVSAGHGASAGALALPGSAAALPLAAPVLAAGPGQPPIIARRAWARGLSHPRVTPGYGAVRLAFVHHTENPNGYSAAEVPAMLRAIYAFHRFVNGWNDIGYNFVIDRFGRIFEARAGGIEEPVVGAHAGGYNLVSSGVAVLGSFMSTPISTSSRRALERLLAWKLSLHGIPSSGRVTVRVNPEGAVYSRFPANARVALPRIAGHRDGDSTDCPGNVLYGELGAIRAGVGRLAPRPPRLTLMLAPPPATQTVTPGSEAPPAPPVGQLEGALALSDGTPLAGVPVQLQARRVSRRGEVVAEQTLAELATDAQGRFAVAASFPGLSGRVSLRALCPAAGSAGAVVSEPLSVRLALSPPAAPAPSPPAAAPPPA
jgi:N-acetylmuramoyl-L-alanine amidase